MKPLLTYLVIFGLLILIFIIIDKRAYKKVENSKDWSSEDVEWMCLGQVIFILFAIILTLIFLFNNSPTPSKYYELKETNSTYIVALEDNLYTQGSHWCTRTEDGFTYAIKSNDGYRIKHILNSDYNITIKLTDIKEVYNSPNEIDKYDPYIYESHPRIQYTKYVLKDEKSWYSWFLTKERSSDVVYLYVPRDCIANMVDTYNVDLQ